MEDPPRRPSKFQYYGEYLTKRFLSKPALHEQQKAALKSLAEWFHEDNVKNELNTKEFTAVVSMPTGTGKTGLICCLPYVLGGDRKITSIDKPILIIAPSLSIMTQLEENLYSDPFLKRPLIELIQPDDPSDYMYTVRSILKTDDVKALKNAIPYDIVLSNSQKWRSTSKTDPVPNYEKLPDDLFSLIIVDEAHHLPAKQWQEILNKFKGFASVVFFTATPKRADGKEITKDLSLSKVGFTYELSRKEAIDSNLIRDIRWEIIPYSDEEKPPAPKKRKFLESDRKKMDANRMEYAEHVLVAIGKRMKKKNRDFPLPGGKKHVAIIAAYSIDEAEEIKRMSEKSGFDEKLVTVVHSVKKKWENEQIVEDIKQGKFEVVIIVQMLLEGFDYPSFSIAGIATRIQSPVKFAQFIGRVQRLVREDGGEENIVADVITHEHFDQEKLKEKYLDPVIPTKEEEDKSLDLKDDKDRFLLPNEKM